MNRDPTHDEMIEFLLTFYPDEFDEFDREEAIYWFASDWHGGQNSNLYSALSTSQYRPGPSTTGPENTMLYDELEAEFKGISHDD